MDHKVLYRKYRPDDFNSIIGQDIIINTLKNAIKNNKVSHAYIFSGPRGTGKTSTAKVFAKALNCLDYQDGPCNKCRSCLDFSTNPDVIEIDAASNNGVDDVRELKNNIRLAPTNSKYKIYIIDEVHMLTTSAFNALLLTLEEPPNNVIFIFATTNIESVPITILSRCQRFDFCQISPEYLKERLKFVIGKEKIEIDEDAIDEICTISEGGLRDALSILDQLSSQNQKITLDVVQSSFNIIGIKTIDQIINCIYDSNTEQLLKIVDNIQKSGYDFKNVIKRIIERLYLKTINNIKDCSKTKELILELNNLVNQINIYVNPYTLFKVVLLSYVGSANKETINNEKITAVSEETREIKDDYKESNYFPGNNFDEQIDELKKIRINNTFVNPTKNDLVKNRKLWHELLNKITDAKLMSLLVDTDLAASSSDYAIITSELEATSHLINVSLQKIEEEFKKNCGIEIKFICVTKEQWGALKKEYLNNIKNNIKYEIVDEKNMGYNKDVLRDIAEDVFTNTIIEME